MLPLCPQSRRCHQPRCFSGHLCTCCKRASPLPCPTLRCLPARFGGGRRPTTLQSVRLQNGTWQSLTSCSPHKRHALALEALWHCRPVLALTRNMPGKTPACSKWEVAAHTIPLPSGSRHSMPVATSEPVRLCDGHQGVPPGTPREHAWPERYLQPQVRAGRVVAVVVCRNPGAHLRPTLSR